MTTAEELEQEFKRLEALPENDISVILDDSQIDQMSDWMDGVFTRFIPDKIVTNPPSVWAEQKRVLPDGLNRIPGQYSWDVNPYMRPLIDLLHPLDPTEYIDIMKGSQITYSTGFLENAIGWIIDENPGPTMFITADKETAEKNIETRIDRMIQEAGIGHKIFSQVEKKSNKRTGDTKARKEFPGGYLIGQGPNSGGKLRNDSFQFLFKDEIDASDIAIKDGDWEAAAERGTNSFEGIRKIVSGSTPKLKETSRIYKRFLLGTQEYFNLPCKNCGKLFVLEFFKDENGRGGLRWDKNPDGSLDKKSVRYHCPHCDHQHKNSDKIRLFSIERGAKWVATAKAKQENRRSFHLNSLYAPLGFESWETIAQKWINAQGDLGALQVFYNLVLGLPWEDRVNAPVFERVQARAGGYEIGSTPPNFKPLIYTLGADVQGDRIEAQILGWGRIKQGDRIASKVVASIDYGVFDEGDTADIDSKVWRELGAFLETQIDGKPVAISCIDAGFNTDVVYEFCSRFQSHVYPVMGDGHISKSNAVFSKFPVKTFNIDRYNLNTSFLKSEIYNNWQKTIQDDGIIPNGFAFIPDGYPESYFKGTFSEYKKKQTDSNGQVKFVWSKIPGRPRNEPLDTLVYGYAGLYIFAAGLCEEMGLETTDWESFWTFLEENQ